MLRFFLRGISGSLPINLYGTDLMRRWVNMICGIPGKGQDRADGFSTNSAAVISVGKRSRLGDLTEREGEACLFC
jgi:hypothetical protein